MPVSPSLTQNLIEHRCSKLRSSISVTHTHTHKNCFTRNRTKISVLTLVSWNSYKKSMRLLSNLHVKGKPAVLPDRALRRQSHYLIYRPRMLIIWQSDKVLRDLRNSKRSKELSATLMEILVSGTNQKCCWTLCLHTLHMGNWIRHEIQQCHCFIPPTAHTTCRGNLHI